MTYLTLAALLAVAPATTQAPRADVRPWEHQTSDLPVDPRIHFGALKNGLRFAWMDNPEPKKRCYLRLHVDVGSLAEEDSERGMAHYLEHMAFNGSQHFPAGSLIEWFQRHGMSFGADTNASTGFSQTIYQLDLPVSDDKTIEEGLQVLRDYANGLSLDQKEIDFERGVIDGEERERDSAGLRLFTETFRLQLSGTRVADRMPIGVKAARDKFDSAALRKFYSTWYRPENMTLVLIGDLQGHSPEALIEKEFADVKKPATPARSEPSVGKLDMAHRFYAIHEAEMPTVAIGIQMAKPFRDKPDNKAELAADLPLGIATAMLNLRFSELRKKTDAPFLRAALVDSRAGMEGLGLRIQEGLVLGISCSSDKWQPALSTCEQELRRALEFGFEQTELEETRAGVLRSLDEAVSREKTRSSASWLGEILEAAENRSVPVEASARRSIAKPLVAALDVDACRHALVKAWSGGELVIGVGGPLDLGADGPKLLKETYEKSRAQKVEARTKTEDKPFAYASDASKVGAIDARSHNEEFDYHDVTFVNGVRLHLKQTDFKKQQILVSVQIGEGQLSLDPARRPLSQVASGILEASGLREHSQDDLRRLNAGKQVGYSFSVGADQFLLSGATTREDLVRELELMCAQLTRPGWRAEGLTEFQKQIVVGFENLKHQHGGPLYSQFLPAVYSGDPRQAWVTQENLEAVKMPAISAWLEPEFATGPIDVVLVGDLDIDGAVAAAARTFGTLAKRRASDPHEERRKRIAMKTGMHEKFSVDTTVPKTLVFIAFPTTDGREAAMRRNLQFLATVLNDRLRIEVREKLGASYSPSASADSSQVAPGDGMIVINAMADPDKVDTLVEACTSAADKLATGGVTQEEVDRLRAPELASFRDALRTNGYWVGALSKIHTSATMLEDLRSGGTYLEKVQPDALTPLAKAYLKRERSNVAIVAPAAEKKDAQANDAAAPKEKH